MKTRTIFKRLTCLVLSCVMLLQLTPMQGLAAADELLRFQIGMTDESRNQVITAAYNGVRYVMGGVLEGKGRRAIAADDAFSTVIDYGGGYFDEYRYVQIRQSKMPTLFGLVADWNTFTYAFTEQGGQSSLHADQGILASAAPGTAPQFWESGWFSGDTWVSGLRLPAGNGNTEAMYLVLKTEDAEPYFAVVSEVNESSVLCEIAVQTCGHPGLTHHTATEATCTESGVREYWSCSLCQMEGRDYKFLDDRGTNAFWDMSQISTPALGHYDDNADGFCERCHLAMPIFLPVTQNSQITAGGTYLLATKFDGKIYLAAPPSDKNPFPCLLPMTDAVTVESTGNILYNNAMDASPIMLQLTRTDDDKNLDGGEYRYTMTATGTASGILECMWGDLYLSQDQYSKYGWRVSLTENGSAPAQITPVEYLPPEEFGSLSAYVLDYASGFSVCTETGIAMRAGVPQKTGSVFLYVMGGGDTPVETWDYELTQAPSSVDYSVCTAESFDSLLAAQSGIMGLADCITEKTVEELVENYRTDTGANADSYTLAAHSDLTVTRYEAGALEFSVRHRVTVTGAGQKPITYELTENQLKTDNQFELTLYAPFLPRQIAMEDGLTYREEHDKLAAAPYSIARPFSLKSGAQWQLSFSYNSLPETFRILETAVMENHTHPWDYETYFYDADGEWYLCTACGQNWKVRDHAYTEFEQDSYDRTAVDYYISTTVASPGTAKIYCDTCSYAKEQAIDPADNWAWLVLTDENGTPIPESYVKNVNWKYKGVIYNETYADVGADCFAWHFDERKAQSWAEDQPLSCQIFFTEAARRNFVVPWSLTYDELELGKPLFLKLQRRDTASLTIVGRLSQELMSCEGKKSVTILSALDEDFISDNIVIKEDGSFRATVLYGQTQVKVNVASRGVQYFYDVQTMPVNEQGEIDLGEIHIRNFNGQEIFSTVVYTDAVPGTVEAARWLGENGCFELVNVDTGEICLDVSVGLPTPQPDSGVRLSFTAGHNFEVGSTLRLDCMDTNGIYTADPYTFVLQERGKGETVLDLNLHKRGLLRNELSCSKRYHSILFDKDGNIVQNQFKADQYVDAGHYTYIAYEANRFFEEIGSVNDMELMKVPEDIYLRGEVDVAWGGEYTVSGTLPAFELHSGLSFTITMDKGRRLGELVPVYISYSGLALTGDKDQTIRLQCYGKKGNDPFVAINGKYATWNGPEEELKVEHYAKADAHAELTYLDLTPQRSEGTICIYLEQSGDIILVTAPDSTVRTLTLPRNEITVVAPASVTNDHKGNFVFYAELAETASGYEGVLYVDGKALPAQHLIVTGHGLNVIPYIFTTSGDVSTHEIWLEVYALSKESEPSDYERELLWISDRYPVLQTNATSWARPHTLTIRHDLQPGPIVIDLSAPTRKNMYINHGPSATNSDGTSRLDITFDYQLSMYGAENIKSKQVLMKAYCGEERVVPEIRNVLLQYNEETGTFDGTLTFRKNEYSVFDIPYGYSFVYDDDSNLDNVVSLKQIAAQLQERASSRSEAEAFEMPPRIDMDELEVRLLNSDKYEEYEKQVIRILAASRNELHDAYTEFFAALKEIPVDETGLTVADMGDLSKLLSLNKDIAAEHLSPDVTETLLLGAYEYYCVEPESMEERIYFRVGDNYTSVVIWSEDASKRLHLLDGDMISSPLPKGTPITSQSAELLSMVVFAARRAAEEEEAFYDPALELIQSAINASATPISVFNTFMSGLATPLVAFLLKVTTIAEKTQEQTKTVITTQSFMQGMVAEAALEEARKVEAKMLADLGPQFLKSDNLLFKDLPIDLQKVITQIRSLERELRDLQEIANLMNNESVPITRSLFQRLRPAVSAVHTGAAKVQKAMGSKFVKGVGGVTTILGIIGGYMGVTQSMQTWLTEVNNGAICLDYGMALFEKAFEDATDPCTSNQIAAMEEVEECMNAFNEYAVRIQRNTDLYGAIFYTKLGIWMPNTITSLASLFTPNQIVLLADLSLGAISGVSECTGLTAIIINDRLIKASERRLVDACIDPLPFDKQDACKEKTPRPDPSPVPPEYPLPFNVLIDPAGYVYEAVASNRLEGATATVWYKGDNGQPVRWDEAPDFGEVNPQITGADGKYAWMTPIGDWLVTVTKDGYYDADSRNDPAAVDGWLPVPPPQMDVNIPMVSKAAPGVESVAVGSDRIRIVFSQYMAERQFLAGQLVSVTQSGAAIPVALRFADREVSPTLADVYYGRVLELTRTDGAAFSGGDMQIRISSAAANYAGNTLGSDYVSALLSVTQIPNVLSHSYPNAFVTDVSKTEEIVILVEDTVGRPVSGVTVTARQSAGGTLQLAESAVSDDHGRAVFAVKGIASGSDTIRFAAGTVSVEMNTRVTPIGTEAPAKPTANLADYETVQENTQLVLSCSTDNAVIYYTTDNSCPCQESENRKLYTGPISVTETTFFRIAAYTETGGYSERLNIHVVVENSNPPVDFDWNNDECTVTLEVFEKGVTVMVASYEGGKMVKLEYLTVNDPSAILTGDNVKVFFLDDEDCTPIRKLMEFAKP